MCDLYMKHAIISPITPQGLQENVRKEKDCSFTMEFMAISPSPIAFFPTMEWSKSLLPCSHFPFSILLSYQAFPIHWNCSCLSQQWVKSHPLFSVFPPGHMLTSKLNSFSSIGFKYTDCSPVKFFILKFFPEQQICLSKCLSDISSWKLSEHLKVNTPKTKLLISTTTHH